MNDENRPQRTTRSVLLVHETGLHARPSILLTQMANRFSSQVWVATSAEGPWTDAKSIARVMALKTPNGATLTFAAEGPDSESAVSALVRLVENDFTPDTKPND